MKKNILKVVFAFVLVVSLTGCGKEKKIETNGKCNVFECMNLISIDNTLEEINNIVGLEGKLTDEQHKIYTYELSDETSLKVDFDDNDKITTIEIDYPNKLITKRANFSKWDEINKKLKTTDSLTYDEFVRLVGNVEGTLEKKGTTSLHYKWLDANGGYLFAYFNSETKKCTLASGRF